MCRVHIKNNHIDRLIAFALSDLPLTGQQALAKHPDASIRLALAKSPTTHVSLIDTLVEDTAIEVVGAALARTTHADRKEFTNFTNHADEYGQHMETQKSALRNPLASEKMLVEALNSGNKTAMFLALLNPTTPETARRQLLRARQTNALCNRTGAYSENNFKAFELACANPWLIEQSRPWKLRVQSIIAHTLDDAAKTVKNLQTNRLRQQDGVGGDAETNPLGQLNAVEALVAELNSSKFTIGEAALLMHTAAAPRAQIIGRLVNRFGIGTLFAVAGVGRIWWAKEMFSAALIAPTITSVTGTHKKLSDLTEETLPFYQDVVPACRILGDSAHRWETFTNLLPHWHGTTIDAAQAAGNI